MAARVRARIGRLAAGALIALGVPMALARAEDNSPPQAHGADVPDSFTRLRAKDTAVQAIGYRLATGNARFCTHTVPASGLLLHDLAGYSDGGPALGRALGLTGPIGVQSIAPGSPAQAAGLRVDDTLIAVDGVPAAETPVDPAAPWGRLQSIEGHLREALARDAPTRLTVARDGTSRTVTLSAVPACPTRFEVAPGEGKRAVADGRRVVIGGEFAGFASPPEEIAAALAHEFAHNLLGHRARLDREGRSADHIRATEREADRMMPWLLANAGYDPAAAQRFMARYRPGTGGGLFTPATHDGWQTRARAIGAELPAVRAAIAASPDGAADWRAAFEQAPAG